MAARGKAWTQAEDDCIAILRKSGKSVRQIAFVLKRGKSSVHNRLAKIYKAQQGVLDLGQAHEN